MHTGSTLSDSTSSDCDYRLFDTASASPWNRRMYEDIVDTLLERCASAAGKETDLSEARVLDVGCGPGGLSVALLTRRRVAAIGLLDLRKGALHRASARIRDMAPDTDVLLFEADVHSIPVEDHAFDLIISRGSQRFWKDQITAMSELRRVLKPDGIAYIGGGRGSRAFQERRTREDQEWFPENFARSNKDRISLPSFMLPDEQYIDLFRKWGDPFTIYTDCGDGHWFCWQKKGPRGR